MREYSFKNDPRGALQHWALKDGQLARRGGVSVVDLGHVTQGRWTDFSYRATRVRKLVLSHPEGELALNCSDDGLGQDGVTFMKLCQAICAELPETAHIHLEQSGLDRLMFWRKPVVLSVGGFGHLLGGMTAPMVGPDYDA